MQNSFRQELRKRLEGFAGGKISLRQFREWYTFEVAEADPPAHDEAWAMMLYISEFDRGHRTENELRELARESLKLLPVS